MSQPLYVNSSLDVFHPTIDVATISALILRMVQTVICQMNHFMKQFTFSIGDAERDRYMNDLLI